MKNKKNIYILLPVVLLIWGAVIFQVFSYLDSDDETTTPPMQMTVKPLTPPKRDTVTINTNYRDPFLGKQYVPSGPISSVKSAKRQTKSIDAPLQWPAISYKGIVSDTKDKSKVFMLIIDGQTALMKVGQEQNGVILKSGDRISATVSFKGQSNKIALQQ